MLIFKNLTMVRPVKKIYHGKFTIVRVNHGQLTMVNFFYWSLLVFTKANTNILLKMGSGLFVASVKKQKSNKKKEQ